MSRSRWLRISLLLVLAFLPRGVQAEAGVEETAVVKKARVIGAPVDFIELSFSPIAQYALREGEPNVNYQLGFLGIKTLRPFEVGKTFGSTRMHWWLRRNETWSDLSTREWAERAGLLWGPNDGDAPSAINQLSAFYLKQGFLEDRLFLAAGKFDVSDMVLLSDYTGDDRETFFSTMISSDAVGRYFGVNGLGAEVSLRNERWSLTALVADAQDDSDFIDWAGLREGILLWAFEIAYRPANPAGVTVFNLVPYHMDETEDYTSEEGLAFGFSHEFGERAEGALFGRYSFRSGGEGLTERVRLDAPPLSHGGFLGAAWNRPFGSADQQLAAALMLGGPSDDREALGYEAQYGLEIYWKFRLFEFFNITPDLQLLRNRAGELEVIPGLRFKLYKSW